MQGYFAFLSRHKVCCKLVTSDLPLSYKQQGHRTALECNGMLFASSVVLSLAGDETPHSHLLKPLLSSPTSCEMRRRIEVKFLC